MTKEYGEQKIKIARGKKYNIPTLDLGELGLAIDTNELFVGGKKGNIKLPSVLKEELTYYVDPVNGSDENAGTLENPFQTIQKAVDEVPIFLNKKVIIDLATAPNLPVTYDEDVLITTKIGSGQADLRLNRNYTSDHFPGPTTAFEIIGDYNKSTGEYNADNVAIGSITAGSVMGTVGVDVKGVKLLRCSPYYDRNAAFEAYTGGEYRLMGVKFGENLKNDEGNGDGIIIYNASADLRKIDVTNASNGITAKRNSSVQARSLNGKCEGYVFRATENSVISYFNSSAKGKAGYYFPTVNSLIKNREFNFHISDNSKMVSINERDPVNSWLDNDGNLNKNNSRIYKEIYVDEINGDNTNDGNLNNPIKSLNYALFVTPNLYSTLYKTQIKLLSDINEEVFISSKIGGAGALEILADVSLTEKPQINKKMSIENSMVRLKGLDFHNELLMQTSKARLVNCIFSLWPGENSFLSINSNTLMSNITFNSAKRMRIIENSTLYATSINGDFDANSSSFSLNSNSFVTLNNYSRVTDLWEKLSLDDKATLKTSDGEIKQARNTDDFYAVYIDSNGNLQTESIYTE